MSGGQQAARSTLPQPGCVLLPLLLCFSGQCVRPHAAQEDLSHQWDPAAELGGAEPASICSVVWTCTVSSLLKALQLTKLKVFRHTLTAAPSGQDAVTVAALPRTTFDLLSFAPTHAVQ